MRRLVMFAVQNALARARPWVMWREDGLRDIIDEEAQSLCLWFFKAAR